MCRGSWLKPTKSAELEKQHVACISCNIVQIVRGYLNIFIVESNDYIISINLEKN